MNIIFVQTVSATRWPRLRSYKTSSCSTQLSMQFILLINVKMPTTIVGIITFISRINTTFEGLIAKISFNFV